MVGVPRSRGCLLCVRRRVRCDEGRPGCAKCATYGAECPGYDRSLKFVTGKHQVRKRGRQGRDHDGVDGSMVVPDASASASVFGAGASTDHGADGYSYRNDSYSYSSNVIVPVFFDPPASTVPPYAIPPSPRDSRAAYVNTILEMINMDRLPTETLFYGSWFNQVPGRLGRKVTLDSAVCSFAMHLLGKSRGDDVLVMQSRQLYGQSLVALQAALNHPTEWRSSETLCTAMVMCLFELFADTAKTSQGWLQHSSAVAHLIQHRGVGGFVEHWDRAMFFSFRSIIIMNSFFTGRDCFLAKKKWQRLFFSDANDDLYGLASPAGGSVPNSAVTMIDRHLAHLAHIPNIMHNGWEIRLTRQHGLPVDLAQAAMLQRSATKLHRSFRTWYADASATYLGNPVYTEVPSNVPEDFPPSPYATVLKYTNPWIASVYLSYVASMLIIQESLNQCAAVRAELLAAQAKTASMAEPDVLDLARHKDKDTEEAIADIPSNISADGSSPSNTNSSPMGSDASASTASSDPVDVTDPPPVDKDAAVPPPNMRPYDASNRHLCRIIFRSFETLGSGLMGQYRIGFSMRVSYEFADMPTQLWIRALLNRSVKTFASSRAGSYPPPKPNEFNYN
ncbi:hypothetical protein SCUCBS95973_007488 [Sporothrix curviconia]|uniref:Zn(2)-C6 fungal-type domain-containing protein n=1 Tax=Sporothrix curviconia TaxID=1260050 RepID=A0ABP0CG55_9PEZI